MVRALIAESVLSSHQGEMKRGSLTLWDHQRDAVVRLRAAIAEFGGALLADEVGLGKTYVALAIAAHYSSPIVVAPAALRSTWSRAFDLGALPVPWVSIESLARAPLGETPDLVIVDEAHHARNPATKRFAALAALCERADVLLLSATPIHNATHDLSALLALFLGAHAYALDDAALGRLIVRRTRDSVDADSRLPVVASPVIVLIADDHTVAERLLALPSPVPPEDGGSADALVTFALVRQWASSVGALRAALRRRIGRTRALADTLRTGRRPSRAEIDVWLVGEDAQQLAFAELLVSGTQPAVERDIPAAVLLDAAEAHGRALAAVVESLGDGADDARAEALRGVLAAHPGERVIAFSQFADTVSAYRRRLRLVPGVCALTATGGTVAGGRLTRAEAIDRFAPHANGARAARAADDVRLLLTTDILSEGVNLQDASVVVHLDLPWTAARIEQRVGRVARAGSAHSRIAVYVMSPPASGEAILGIERRLRGKISAAAASVGVPASHVADAVGVELIVAPPAACELLRAVLRGWTGASEAPLRVRSGVPYAVVRSAEHGWLAVLRSSRGQRLVASFGGRVGIDPVFVAAVARLASEAHTELRSTDERPASERRADELSAAASTALESLDRWLSSETAATLAGVPDIPALRRRRATLARFADLESLPRMRRAALDQLASAARQASSGRMSRGLEVAALAAIGEADSEAWLRRLAGLTRSGHMGDSFAQRAGNGAGAGAGEVAGAGDGAGETVAALLVLLP